MSSQQRKKEGCFEMRPREKGPDPPLVELAGESPASNPCQLLVHAQGSRVEPGLQRVCWKPTAAGSSQQCLVFVRAERELLGSETAQKTNRF